MISVFLVDDDRLVLDELTKNVPWLDNGFEVVGSSTSPLRALREIEERKPEVVFTDMQMAGMDGLQLMEELMRKGARPRFVMVSAFASFELSRRFFLANGFDFVRKPIQLVDVELVLERLYGALSTGQPVPAAAASPAFTALVEHLKQNFNQKFSLNQLAAQFGLAENYICNLFAKHYNSTLTKFVTELRMQEADRLIKSTTMPIKEIAMNCGYGDYFYFNKVFKTFYGISPGMYCKMARKGETHAEPIEEQ